MQVYKCCEAESQEESTLYKNTYQAWGEEESRKPVLKSAFTYSSICMIIFHKFNFAPEFSARFLEISITLKFKYIYLFCNPFVTLSLFPILTAIIHSYCTVLFERRVEAALISRYHSRVIGLERSIQDVESAFYNS